MGEIDVEFLKSVALQMLAGGGVKVAGEKIPVRNTSQQRLKTVRFQMNGREYEAIEQNPEKPSRWGKLARDGHGVVQFRDVLSGKYVAVAVDGKVRVYGR
jgi:hypothetical protein